MLAQVYTVLFCLSFVLYCILRYDPKTDTWTTVSSLSVPRDAVGVCLLGDRLYAVGGYDGQTYLNSVESYDAQNNEWTEVSPSSNQAAFKVVLQHFWLQGPHWQQQCSNAPWVFQLFVINWIRIKNFWKCFYTISNWLNILELVMIWNMYIHYRNAHGVLITLHYLFHSRNHTFKMWLPQIF